MATTIKKYPIWNDTAYSLTPGVYYIKDGDTIIYQGYAQPADSTATKVNVYLRNVLRNYLTPELALNKDEKYSGNTSQSHTFTLWYENATTAAFNITVWWDYSYSIDWQSVFLIEGGITSQPINYHWAKGQIIPVSFFSNATETGRWMYSDGTSSTTINSDGLITTLTVIPDSSVDYFHIYDNAIDPMSPAMTYKTSDKRCGYGSLYYINKVGGWDAFLLEYNITVSQDIEKQNYSTGTDYFSNSFDETYITKSIRTKYSTNTGWLSDESSKILYDNLLTSPAVYFQYFEEDTPQLRPVNFTSTSFTKKEFKNGKHLISYDLEFKESHIKLG